MSMSTTFKRSKDLRNRYGVSNVTLWRWVKAGKLPAPRYINGKRVWSVEQIEECDRRILKDKFDKGGARK